MKHSRTAQIWSMGLALVLAAGTSMAAGTQPAGIAVQVPQPWIELNGTQYHVAKVDLDGEVAHIFFDGQSAFTRDELKAHLAAQQPQKISGQLETVLMNAAPDELVEVVIVLRHQPTSPISRAVWAEIAEQREALASGMRQITGRPLARPSMPDALERHFVPLPLTQEELEQRRELALQLKALETQARQEIHQRIARAIAPGQEEVVRAVGNLGGEVTARIDVMNIVAASLTPQGIRRLAENPLVAEIDFDHPGEPELDNSRLALMVHTGFWSNNFTGGVFSAGVLDTGVEMNHPALASHPYLSNMGSSDTGTHGTHIAGIMMSTDSTYRGMAWGADKIVFSRAGGSSTSMSGMAFIASTGEADVCNYSFGNGSASTTDYASIDRFFDGVISSFGYLVSKSTGNGGFGSGDPTITHPAPAFNLLAVANIDDRNTPTRNDDWIRSSSSRGPTAGGRKKPDIAAPGSGILSANANWQTGSNFRSGTGTSMAAPHVGAAVLLLYDMGVNDTKAAKAVLINTADAIEDNNSTNTANHYRVPGSRWNRRYGWGYMHLAKAYLGALDYFVDTVSTDTPRERFRLYAGEMFQHEKATLVWERHVTYNGTSYPTQIRTLSDLDLFAYRAADGALMDSSTSAIDNVEQISIPPGQQGEMVLKVKAIGNFDPGLSEEEFALATQENFSPREGPLLEINLQHPATANPGSAFDVSVMVTNNGDLPAHDIAITLNGPVTASTNPVIVSSLAPSASVPVLWSVSAETDPGIYPLSVSAVSNAYGEEFTSFEHSGYSVGPVVGELLITNMPGNDESRSTNLAGGRIKAMGFTLPPGSDYALEEVHLRLNIATVPTFPLVRIFDDVGGLPTNSMVTLDNPSITTTGIGNYAFTPPSTFTLEEDTPYWLVVYNTISDSMHWKASSPPQLPAGIAEHSGSLWNGNTGPNPPVDPSAIINSYSIIATPLHACYADCNSDGDLNISDFLCFIDEFAVAQALPHAEQMTHYANCDGSTTAPVLTISDFLCFIDEFAQGCP